VGNSHQSHWVVVGAPKGDRGSCDLSKNRIAQKENFDGLGKQFFALKLPKKENFPSFFLSVWGGKIAFLVNYQKRKF